jgi:hypothetical protein
MSCKHLLFPALYFFSVNIVHAQVPPGIDPPADQWILNVEKSDEFNAFTLDTAKWWYVDACTITDNMGHGFNSPGSYDRPQNVTLDSGYLIMKLEVNPDSANWNNPCHHGNNYPFWGGSIMSAQKNAGTGIGPINSYSFGYYEMKGKLPGYYDANHNPVGYGFYPTFWIFYQYAVNHCIIKHDEVDIMEADPYTYYNGCTYGLSWHDENDSCGTIQYMPDSITCPTPLFDGFHKFGAEVLPNKIVFYFDDKPYVSADTITSPAIVHSLNMAPYLDVFIGTGTGGAHGYAGPLPNATFPNYMYVDYFRYYQLNTNQNVGNKLFQNSPNPVNTSAVIEYSMDNNAAEGMIKVYAITGAEITTVKLNSKGKSTITLSVADLLPGIYFYRFIVDGNIIGTKKMVVMR